MRLDYVLAAGCHDGKHEMYLRFNLYADGAPEDIAVYFFHSKTAMPTIAE